MFDWVKKLLFEEEEIVVEENKLEEIDFTKVNDLENIITETPQEEKVEEPVVEEVIVEEVKENPVPIKKEFNIQLDEPTPSTVQESAPKRRVEREKIERERVERPERNDKETSFEMMSVISPMFGGKEVKKSSPKASTIITPKKKDSIGIVISPMYGQKELQEHQAQATVKIEENKNKQKPLIEDDDWKNDIPLDELISSVDETNDCVQFSLFGDNQSINE